MPDSELRKRVEELEAQVENLTLSCRALQELCLKKKLFTREELKTLAQMIDSVDGSVDGRTTRVGRAPRRGD